MDCDFSHNPEDLPRLEAACIEGAGVAVRSRYVTGVNVVNWPMSRVLLSYFASICAIHFGMPIQDATAGFDTTAALRLKLLTLVKSNSLDMPFKLK